MAIFQEMKRIGETASWHASIHIAARKVQRAWKSYYVKRGCVLFIFKNNPRKYFYFNRILKYIGFTAT